MIRQRLKSFRLKNFKAVRDSGEDIFTDTPKMPVENLDYCGRKLVVHGSLPKRLSDAESVVLLAPFRR